MYEYDVLNVPTYGGRIYARRHGNVVDLIINEVGVNQNIPANPGDLLICTLPVKYRPKNTVFSVGSAGQAITSDLVKCQVLSNGAVYLYSSSVITSTRLCCSYLN